MLKEEAGVRNNFLEILKFLFYQCGLFPPVSSCENSQSSEGYFGLWQLLHKMLGLMLPFKKEVIHFYL